MTPMLQVSPLSPERVCASRDSGTFIQGSCGYSRTARPVPRSVAAPVQRSITLRTTYWPSDNLSVLIKVPTGKARPSTVAIAAVCTLGLAFNIWIAAQNKADWGSDYNQFYAASRLAGTGHVYDWEALRKIEAEHGGELRTGRLPVVLYGHKLLGSLPYAVARSIWMAGSAAALVFLAAFWPGTRRWIMMVALAWSMPAAQDRKSTR